MFDTIPGTLMCQIHKFSHFLQRVHCVEVKSAVDVEMFTALPDSASSLFTATQTANGHDLPRLFHGKEPGTDCLRKEPGTDCLPCSIASYPVTFAPLLLGDRIFFRTRP